MREEQKRKCMEKEGSKSKNTNIFILFSLYVFLNIVFLLIIKKYQIKKYQHWIVLNWHITLYFFIIFHVCITCSRQHNYFLLIDVRLHDC